MKEFPFWKARAENCVLIVFKFDGPPTKLDIGGSSTYSLIDRYGDNYRRVALLVGFGSDVYNFSDFTPFSETRPVSRYAYFILIQFRDT